MAVPGRLRNARRAVTSTLLTVGLTLGLLVSSGASASAACPEKTIPSLSTVGVLSGDGRTLVQLRSTQVNRQPAVVVIVNGQPAGIYRVPQLFYSGTMLAYVKNEQRPWIGIDGVTRYQAVSTYKVQACYPPWRIL